MIRLGRYAAGCWGLALLLTANPGDAATGAPDPARTVVALYASGDEVTRARVTRLHQIAQMPLNHLGLYVVYHDVSDGLPSAETIARARGLITWFDDSGAIAAPRRYVELLATAARTDTRFVLFGHPGFDVAGADDAGRRALQRLGVDWTGESVGVTYDAEVVAAEPGLTGYERAIEQPVPPFPVVEPSLPGARTWLKVRSGGGRVSHVVMTSPAGGYAANGYALYQSGGDDDSAPQLRAWLIDPFRFFATAFATDGAPKPDPTTFVGRRVYYSHIDGDGWMNRTLIEGAPQSDGVPVMAAEVIRREVIEGYPQLPVTVAPIAAELDTAWHGTAESRRVARDIFALANVEVGNHTYSHPFAWSFFAAPDHREREEPFFDAYPGADRLVGALGRLRSALGLGTDDGSFEGVTGYRDYERPRAYALAPFSLELEIDRARAVIAALTPDGKPVATYQWSGNTAPFPEMIAAVAQSGMANINGGDSRFDPEYPSYAWSAPLGLDVDGQWQVFASNSNENTYTDNWTGRYFGFRYLPETLRNEDRPRRISAFNVYYHMYSGDRSASMTALTANLEYALTRPIVPVAASRYARAVQGFRTVRFEALAPARWAVHGRGALQTVRFDKALFRAVDFARSHGVLGQRRRQGALYVALDPNVEQPIIALRDGAAPDRAPTAERAYLIESAWPVRGLEHRASGFVFSAGGYLDGAMRWWVPDLRPRRISVRIDGRETARFTATPGADGELTFTLGQLLPRPWPKGPTEVTVRPIDD